MNGLTASIADFINEKSLTDFPPGAVDKSKKAIMDTAAAILSGAASEVAKPLLAYLAMSSHSGESPILGTAQRCDAESAALINGTFGHARDFDDVLSMMPAHPSAVIFAALCADLRARPLSGAQFIEAHVIGVEVGGKLGLGITTGHYHRGFHGTGTLGIFCGVAALAKAYRLPPATIRTAFGITASMASGLRRNFGTMTKPLHTGWAAQSALTATRLALSGFTASADALEGRSGFFETYGVENSSAQATADGLGNPWVIVAPGIALKKFPCCYASHRAMDGVLALRAKHRFTAEEVVRLTCRMPPGGMQVLTYPRPTTGLEAKFSLEYALAAGILDGRYTLWSFTDEAVNRAEISSLLDRVSAAEDPRCRGDDPAFETRSSGSRGLVEVEVELRNGTQDSVRIAEPPGHPSRELSWDDLEGKFRDCARAARLEENKVRAAIRSFGTLETQKDMAAVINSLQT